MPLRDLVCMLEAGEKPAEAALAPGLALARSYGAQASVVVVGSTAAAPFSMFGAKIVGGLQKSENEKLQSQADALGGRARDAIAKTGVKGTVELCLKPYAEMVQQAKIHALAHDLVVMDRPGGAIEHSQALLEEMLFAVCSPVLLPANSKPTDKIGKIAFAWDGSAHAARSLAAALALFDGLQEADVVVVQGEKDLSGIAPATKIAEHIQRHGAKVSVAELKLGESVATTIDTHAAKAGADLIVMGAFGRTRLREFTFGGVTRDLTLESSVPLLLAH